MAAIFMAMLIFFGEIIIMKDEQISRASAAVDKLNAAISRTPELNAAEVILFPADEANAANRAWFAIDKIYQSVVNHHKDKSDMLDVIMACLEAKSAINALSNVKSAPITIKKH